MGPTRSFGVFLALLFFTLSFTLSSTVSFAKSNTYIPVGSAKIKKSVIAFPEILLTSPTSSPMRKALTDVVKQDLIYMDIVKILDPAAYKEDSSEDKALEPPFKYDDWTKIGAEFVIKSKITQEARQNLTFEAHVYDTFGKKEILSKKYRAPTLDIKILAHTFANDLVNALTGLPGIFLTKIAMSCDMSGKKEIYMMDFDGSNIKQVTRHHSIAFAPAWSPDGTRIAYSLYNRHANNIRNIDLFEFNFSNNTIRLLSNKRGINSGVAYSPDGKSAALTLSYLGTPEIFSLNLTTGSTHQVTKSFGFDVDPAWSPDGKKIAFVSSRSGIPMVYSTNANGTDPVRLTYAGRYNATPTWSPQNNKIGFAGWIDKSFDIFIMNPDGTHIERLTKGQGNNEDPFFSPDGNFIVFSSNRTGQKNIYVMNIDGTFVKRLTYGLGNCVSPKWSMVPLTSTQEAKAQDSK